MSDDFTRMLEEQWPEARDRILKEIKEKGSPRDLAKLPPDVFEDLYGQARGAYAVENYVQAENMFQGLALFKGDDVRVWLGYAGACEAQKKWEQAAVGYAMAMALKPGDPVPAYRAGISMLNMNKKDEARQLLELAAGTREEMKNDSMRMPYVERAQSMLDMLDGEGK